MRDVQYQSGDAVSERLQTIFRDVFSAPDLILHNDLTAEDVPGWDSLGHITLMFSIETEFGITFTDTELLGLQNVGELREVILHKTTT